jgi:iron complex transport system permease protein
LGPVLVGVGVSALLGSLVGWLMVEASIDTAARANVWLTGTLNGRGWTELWVLTAVTGAAAMVLVPASARLTSLALGTDVARGLGVRVGPSLAVLLLVAVALASTTTAMIGPIAFVALVCPHLARLACGAARPPLAASAALGALLLTAADLAARTAVPTVQVPAGAVTALIGAPFLLWLLVRTRSEASR